MKTTADLVEIINRIPTPPNRDDFNKMLIQLIDESKTASGREHEELYQLATMLLYELYPNGAAMNMATRSAELNLIPPIYRTLKAKGWSYNEVFFSTQEKYQTLLEDASKILPRPEKQVRSIDANHPLAKFFKDISGVLVLSEEHKVCAYRDKEGYLVLVSWLDTPGMIYADEDFFLDTPPLWFTEDSHFCSPVWAMKIIYYALQHMIVSTGMARVPIRCELITTKAKTVLVNFKEIKERCVELHMKTYNSSLETHPLDALSFKALPMYHLWQYFFSLVECIDFKKSLITTTID